MGSAWETVSRTGVGGGGGRKGPKTSRRIPLLRGIAKRLGVMSSQVVIIAECESRSGRRRGNPRTANDNMGMEIRRARKWARQGRVEAIGSSATERLERGGVVSL